MMIYNFHNALLPGEYEGHSIIARDIFNDCNSHIREYEEAIPFTNVASR